MLAWWEFRSSSSRSKALAQPAQQAACQGAVCGAYGRLYCVPGTVPAAAVACEQYQELNEDEDVNIHSFSEVIVDRVDEEKVAPADDAQEPADDVAETAEPVDGAPTNWRIVVLKNAQVPAGEGLPYLRHNGPIETGLASWYRHDDCLVIAFNNACGGMYLTRQQMAEIDSRFSEGHISLKAIARVVDRHTPFNMQLQRSLQRSFDVFTVAEGIYIVALVLVRSDGAIFTHAIAVDRNHNVINFGPNDDCDEQITIHPEGFETENESSAKEGLLSYFKDLKNIEVADVWCVWVETKRLAEGPHAALLLPPAKEKREVNAATDSPPAKKMKVAAKALEDMTVDELEHLSIDELQEVYKQRLNVNQVRGSSARKRGWLIRMINGGLTVRAKRARDRMQDKTSKRPRN